MNQYWQAEFKNAFARLEEKMYLPDGYNYDSERGIVQYDSDGNEIDMLIEMISLRTEILKVKRMGGLVYEFRSYTIRIYNLLGVGV